MHAYALEPSLYRRKTRSRRSRTSHGTAGQSDSVKSVLQFKEFSSGRSGPTINGGNTSSHLINDSSPGHQNVNSLTFPGQIRTSLESVAGLDMSGIRIHPESPLPAKFNALSFTQGNSIHIAPGQFDLASTSGIELLGHELAHVKQQRQGRVSPTTRAHGIQANDDRSLEKEADEQGKKAVKQVATSGFPTGSLEEKSNDCSPRSCPIQFRLPTYSNLETVFKNATLSIPESTVISMISRALLRMKKDGQLLSKDPIPKIIKRIFPSPGKIVESEFNKVVDVKDRDRIYRSVLDTNAPVKPKHRSKLKRAMKEAVKVIRLAQKASYRKAIERVFGSKAAQAQANYKKSGDELDRLKASDAALDAGINTDYNKDDPAMGLGGWAGGGVMHLQSEIAEVKDHWDSMFTLIHEAAHLANNSIDDKGYYPPSTGKDAFSGMSEDVKLTNAAHYEEWPRRWLGKSKYGEKVVFTPGKSSSGGGALTPEDNARDEVSQYFRKAWDAGVDAQFGLRDRRKEILAGNSATFLASKTEIINYSKLADLSIHKQASGNETITQLDVVLAEGVPREAMRIGGIAKKLAITVPIAKDTDVPAAKEQLIDDSIKRNKTLLGDAKKDRKLLDYLKRKYRSIPF